jgi:hypothetical protein
MVMITRLNGPTVIGLTEKITLYGPKGKKEIIAKIDTGASKSSIDEKLAEEIGMTEKIGSTIIKTAHGNRRRPVIKEILKIKGRTMQVKFTIADRKHMKYRALIGLNVLKRGFLIDPSKKIQ